MAQPGPPAAGGRRTGREAAEGRCSSPPVGQGLDPVERRSGQTPGDPRPPRLAGRSGQDAREVGRVPRARGGRSQVHGCRPARHGRLESLSGRAASHVRHAQGPPEAPRARHDRPRDDPRCAVEMEHSCADSGPVESNPGAWLGAVMGKLATQGRNKLTLIASPKVATFGYWVEQLLAESTGKEGKGIVPIEGEPVGKPAMYGDDRLFVYIRMDADPPHRGVQALVKAGHPVITLTMRDKLDLGGEFLRWEVATAIAGSVLGIDAFDQPNVQESKDNTRKVLGKFKQAGKLPAADSMAAAKAKPGLASLLKQAKRGAYFAIMAYTKRTPGSEAAIAAIRTSIRDRTKIATTAGYGPRFLHSTGQLHKGGPKPGLFLQIVQDDAKDVKIPGQPYSFSVLKQAQSLGDLQSLTSRRLPVLRVTVGRDPAAGWRALAAAVKSAVR